MRIAILSYGSLANQPTSPVNGKSLNVSKLQGNVINHQYNLNHNSPFILATNLQLPVELGRLSSADTANRRVTMTIQENAPKQQVFVAKSNYENLDQSIRDLRLREGVTDATNIAYVNLTNGKQRSKHVQVANKIKNWAGDNHFDAVVWTQLSSNINPRDILRQTANDAVLRKNTQNYIRNLPTNPSELQQSILNQGQNQGLDALNYKRSLTADFPERDRLPQCNSDKNRWQEGGIWGPSAAKYPRVEIPAGVTNKEQWMRDRVLAVAKRYEVEKLKYKTPDGTSLGKRGHFPARGHGLDCSNFSAWVYNYGLGIQFSTGVDDQMNPQLYKNTMGPLIKDKAPQVGDLLFFKAPAGSNVAHVVIYAGKNERGQDVVIDSTSGKSHVAVRESNYWASVNNPRYVGFRSPIAQACKP